MWPALRTAQARDALATKLTALFMEPSQYNGHDTFVHNPLRRLYNDIICHRMGSNNNTAVVRCRNAPPSPIDLGMQQSSKVYIAVPLCNTATLGVLSQVFASVAGGPTG